MVTTVNEERLALARTCAVACVAIVFAGACGPKPAPKPPERGALSLEEARSFVLGLINDDRQAHGLLPVALSQPAQRAGQRHTEDMAAHGFTAHYGRDGSVPESRFVQEGGSGLVTENVGCFADGQPRTLMMPPRFDADELERMHASFMDEVPPYDGHRRNVLDPTHTHVGIGLARAEAVNVPCMAQEFVDDYGDYAPLPKAARVGDRVVVAGELHEPAAFGGVGVSRAERPVPLRPAELNETGMYAVPAPHATYYPEGFVTPQVVAVDGASFSVEIALDDGGREGRYGVSIWARLPERSELVLVSLRTIDVTAER